MFWIGYDDDGCAALAAELALRGQGTGAGARRVGRLRITPALEDLEVVAVEGRVECSRRGSLKVGAPPVQDTETAWLVRLAVWLTVTLRLLN